MTTTLPNRIIKYFVDTSNPSQSGFYFYEKAEDWRFCSVRGPC